MPAITVTVPVIPNSNGFYRVPVTRGKRLFSAHAACQLLLPAASVLTLFSGVLTLVSI